MTRRSAKLDSQCEMIVHGLLRAGIIACTLVDMQALAAPVPFYCDQCPADPAKAACQQQQFLLFTRTG